MAGNMTSESVEWSQRLRERGLRPTRPRLAVLSFLTRRGEHLTPAQIFHGLREAGQAVSIATLYQNLEALSRRGLIKRIVAPDGTVRYDVNLAPHHHLVCQGCGQLVDVELSAPLSVHPVAAHRVGVMGSSAGPGGGGALPGHDPEGWTILSAQVEFRGLCPACARRRPVAARRPRSHRPGRRLP